MKSTTAKPAAAKDTDYPLVFREGGGKTLEAITIDRILYPKALAWIRLFSSNRDRVMDKEKEDQLWRDNGREAILQLAGEGEVAAAEAEAFIVAAAASGVVQVEMKWERENLGYAARVFPWEALLSLATKQARKDLGKEEFIVVRMLRVSPRSAAATGPAGFGVTESALNAGFDTLSERAAIGGALEGGLEEIGAKSLAMLARDVAALKPRIVHLVLSSRDGHVEFAAKQEDEPTPAQVAKAVAAHGPEIATFSSCYTGRRLAPLAVAKGAGLALGFQGEVMDASIPVFFGAFYRAWNSSGNPLDAMRAGLAANRAQAIPADLGYVTLWSGTSVLPPKTSRRAAPADDVKPAIPPTSAIPDCELAAALPVICTMEEALNYSVLQNSRGGLFRVFAITKIKPGSTSPLEITVRLDTGLDRPAECHFFANLPPEPDRQQDLAAAVTLPLGSQLLRQRGEILLGTVEVFIACGGVRIFHRFQSIKLLPCDEWRDDETGRHLLPSFILPRDPAIREIVTAAQPFLRALFDQPQAGFDGYQLGFVEPTGDGEIDSATATRLQSQAFWAALQSVWRLDYVSPPPAYTKASQRLRTPEEILRAGRGTCIELALMLAACWEHVGIFPVIFLTTGHAFAGCWTSDSARRGFLENLAKLGPVEDGEEPDEAGKSEKCATEIKEPWMFSGLHNLTAIRREIRAGRLVPLEATYIPLQKSFKEATERGRHLLTSSNGTSGFDGMLDVQTARDRGVTPLAIVTQGVVA